MKNRSVPTDGVLPHLTYEDLSAAISWLTATFGFVEHFRYGDPIQGAQMHLGDAWIMVHGAGEGSASPRTAGVRTQSLTIFVEDVDAHFQKAKAAGAAMVEELHETVYGEFQFAADDPEGHRWIFSRHARDLSPSDWGAVIAD